MKKIYSLLSVLLSSLILLTACGDSQEFTLKGTLGTHKDQHILVVYDDPIAKIDTIIPLEGKFEYSFVPDTITLMRLVSDSGYVYPIFANKGWTVNCKGTFSNPIINGDGDNKDYWDFHRSIQEFEETNPDTVCILAEKFIRSHPQSFASAYLIDEYFIQRTNPDVEKINSLIIPLNGEVKDSRVLNVAMKSMPTEGRSSKDHLSYYSLRDRKQEYISWNTKKDQKMLINFYASWDIESVEATDSLYAIVKKLPKNSIKVLNISLDYNKEEWLKTCKKDLDSWVEVCSFTGWETPIVKQNNILRLPSNIMIDNQRKIIERDCYGESLTKLFDQKQEKSK